MALVTDDIVAIQQLMARYNHAIDAGDSGAFADTFTEDGVFEVDGDVFKGRQELAGFADRFRGMVKNPRHFATNPVIEGDGDEATLLAYVHVTRTTGDPPRTVIMTTGSYDDTLRRVNGQWRFTTRRFTRDY